MTAHLDAMAEQARLGGFRRTFRPTRRRKWAELTPGAKAGQVIAMVLGLALVAFIIVVVWVANSVAGLVVLAGMVGLFLLARRGTKIEARNSEGRELRFYERGVAVVETGGATMKAFRWDDASVLQNITKHYRNGVYTHTSYLYTLSGPGGETARVKGGTIGGFEAPDTWGTEIQQQVTAVQLPPALATIQAGLTLEFGPFAVNAERLSAGGKSVAWSEVQEIRTNKGYLSIKQQGRWLNMTTKAVSQIPNFFVFRTLADLLVEAARTPR
ncbi:hypothetical protein LN042_20935 [Kitasatospora sp. RB6PN24]|uniref:DUF6585 family protein n=1 Tax=Kitasatospora humi TaxID=2893891 RepID=UPI001E2B11A9|nr:DUF6585 family protein [Kitasatospora humi]MCC9309514.1 hypothetical protein [Kitasatospora humi]